MRVLIVHNRYRSDAPSGEGRIVDLEAEGLGRLGVDVHRFERHSDELERSRRVTLEAAAAPFLPAAVLSGLRARLQRVRPDVLHLHNPVPLIPPGLITVAREEGIPVVQTLHNARHACPKSDFFRDGAPCFDCRGLRFAAPAVVHGCYRGSRYQSLGFAAGQAFRRSTFAQVDRFIAVSESLRELLVGSRLPRERIAVIPNGIPDPGEVDPVAGEYFFYAGRFEEEKGVLDLLDAWKSVGGRMRFPLLLAGSGELDDQVRATASRLPNVRVLGRLDSNEVLDRMRRSIAVIVPSRVPESFGLTAVEAFSVGRPVVASPAGALRELIDGEVGWLADSPAALGEALMAIDPADALVRGSAARRRFLQEHTLDRSMRRLLALFNAVTRD